MACISKLANAIAYDCDTGATGLVSALIINKEDIASYVLDGTNNAVTALTLAPNAKVYRIDTVKRSLVVSSTLKVNEGAPNAYTHSASLVITQAANSSYRAIRTALTNGSFVVLAARYGIDGAYIYGLYYGLHATASENSSHDNGGWTTATLETPENVIGEDTLLATKAVYNNLYAAALS